MGLIVMSSHYSVAHHTNLLCMTKLSPFDSAVLMFEQAAPRCVGTKEDAIRDEFGLSAVRYHQYLNKLIDAPEAYAEHPQLVARLRRIRDNRASRRAAAKI